MKAFRYALHCSSSFDEAVSIFTFEGGILETLVGDWMNNSMKYLGGGIFSYCLVTYVTFLPQR